MTPAANGTDERLDAVLAELRAIRVVLEAGQTIIVHVDLVTDTAKVQEQATVDHLADAAKAKRKRPTAVVDRRTVDVTKHSAPLDRVCGSWPDDPADVIE